MRLGPAATVCVAAFLGCVFSCLSRVSPLGPAPQFETHHPPWKQQQFDSEISSQGRPKGFSQLSFSHLGESPRHRSFCILHPVCFDRCAAVKQSNIFHHLKYKLNKNKSFPHTVYFGPLPCRSEMTFTTLTLVGTMQRLFLFFFFSATTILKDAVVSMQALIYM